MRGLRARVAGVFTLGALLLSSVVGSLGFLLVQSNVLQSAESQHQRQSVRNAIEVRQRLLGLPANADDDQITNTYISALSFIPHPNGSDSLVLEDDGKFRSLSITTQAIPAQMQELRFRDAVESFHMRYAQADDTKKYIVGVKLPGVDATYYEIVSLNDADSTLRSLSRNLLILVVVASLAGAIVGSYSARGVLSPVSRISSAARAIANGDFSTQLDLPHDPDLSVLTDAFNDMVKAVSARIEREQRFTSDVSHELRSPLMTLTASVEILERRKESLPDAAQQATELLSEDLLRFKRLMHDLLEISRAEAGALQLEISHFLLLEFMEHVIAQASVAYIEIEHSERDTNTILAADKRRLFQVITNLIENAEKYGDGATSISFEVIEDRAQIVVSDLGPGVPRDERDRVFERFGRIGSSAGNRSGSTGFGLGLSLVAEHVKLHNGRVWVTDRIDGRRGARFVVELPLRQEIADEDSYYSWDDDEGYVARVDRPHTDGEG